MIDDGDNFFMNKQQYCIVNWHKWGQLIGYKDLPCIDKFFISVPVVI